MLAMRQARLSAAACAARKLTPAALPLFTDGEPGELVLPECSQLEPAVLAPALALASGEQCACLHIYVSDPGGGTGALKLCMLHATSGLEHALACACYGCPCSGVPHECQRWTRSSAHAYAARLCLAKCSPAWTAGFLCNEV